MTDAQEKAREDYLEVFSYNGEIEFTYGGHFYHIEPDTEADNTYNIWQFANRNGDDGKMIAQCTPSEAVLEEKAFDGKTILEIEDDMTDCILR